MSRKLVVFGGNGFVGSRVVQKALAANWKVIVACRSGAPIPLDAQKPWVQDVEWITIDALDRLSVYQLFQENPDITSVASTIGLLTWDHKKARRINGDANVNIAAAVYESKLISRYILLSAANFGFPFSRILRGYYEGKGRGERAIRETLHDRAAILRPGMIYGSRALHNGYTLPLGLIGKPMEFIFRPLWNATQMKCLVPPVSVDTLAEAAVSLAGDKDICGTFEYWDIVTLSEKYKKFDVAIGREEAK